MSTICAVVALSVVVLDRLASYSIWRTLVRRARQQDLAKVAKHFGRRRSGR